MSAVLRAGGRLRRVVALAGGLVLVALVVRVALTGELQRWRTSRLSAEDLATRAARADASYDVLMEWATRLMGTLHFEGAQRVFQRAADVRPTSGEAWAGWAKAAFAAGAWDQAQEILDRAVDLFPNRADLLFTRASLLSATGRPGRARRDLERGVKLDPRSADAWRALGDLQFEAKEYVAASLCYRKSMNLSNRSIPVRRNLGACLVEMGLPSEARLLLEDVLKEDPSDLEARYQLGSALAAIGTREFRSRALAELNRVSTFAPGNARPWLRVARLWVSESNLPDASQALEHAVDADPTSEEAVRLLLEVYEKLGRRTEAMRQKLRIQELEAAERTRARILRDLEDSRDVPRDLERLARFQLLRNRPEQAVSTLRAAHRLAPGDPAIRKALEELEPPVPGDSAEKAPGQGP